MNAEKKKAVKVRLNELTEANGGRLTPEDVVRDAKKPSSPLNDLFEWDVKKAAHQNHLAKARQIIKFITIEIRTETRVVKTVKYVRDPVADAKEQGYIEVESLATDEALSRQALESELSRASALMNRAVDLSVALNLEDECNAILERIEQMQTRIRCTVEDLAA